MTSLAATGWQLSKLLLLDPQNGTPVGLPSSTHFINDYFRIVFTFKSHIRVDTWACINVFPASDSLHYIRQSLWDECRSSHFTHYHQLVGFLVFVLLVVV